MEKSQLWIMPFPYEPRPNATTKEVLADPRNWIFIVVVSVAAALSMYILIYLVCWLIFITTGQDITPLFRFKF